MTNGNEIEGRKYDPTRPEATPAPEAGMEVSSETPVEEEYETAGEITAEEQKEALDEQEKTLLAKIEEIIPVVEKVRNIWGDINALREFLLERQAAKREEKFQEEKGMGKYAGGGEATRTRRERGIATLESGQEGMFRSVRGGRTRQER